MISNNVVVINGTSYEVVNQGTESIDNGTWITVRGVPYQIVAIDPSRYYAEDVMIETKPKQPFWSKQGKNKKGGRSKY